MKRRVLFGVFLGLALSAGLVTAPQAFTLGDLRGSVIIGRGLDLSVMVQAAPNEEVSAACFAADVFHADTPQAPATVTVTPQPGAANPAYKVRIQSRALVDEPVVTVQLRSTCATPFTRRYVVLADFPVVVMPAPEPAPALPVVPAPTATPAPTAAPATPVAVPPGDTATAAATGVAKAPLAAPAPAVVKPAPAAKPRPARKKPAATKPAQKPKPAVATPAPATVAEPAKPALKLETLNLPSGQADGLAATPLTLPSAQSVLQAKQIETLQAELKALKDLTAKNNAALAQMQVQLQKAQTERVSLQLFYVVLALLFLSISVLVWLLWQRYRDQPAQDAGASILTEMAASASASAVPAAKGNSVPPSPGTAQSWWHAESGTAPTVPVAKSAPAVAAAPVQTAAKTVVPATLQDLNHAFTNTRLQEMGDSNFGVIAHEEVDLDIDMSSWAGLDDAGKSVDSAAESIVDIRQQAEFFVSLGQTERAVFVLKKQIAEAAQPNPFIYLDLLSLFHSLGYKTDFREYRTAFNRHFNCVLPDFPAYHLEGLDLMAYGDELARLTQVWNRKEVLAYLNACIYRSEQASAQPSFELAAFRDLLLLLAIAEQVQAQA